MTRVDRLRKFLKEVEDCPIVWGKTDCTSLPARWLAEEAGVEVSGLNWFGLEYRTQDQANLIIEKHGSLYDAWRITLHDQGINEQYCDPSLGDIGLVHTHTCGMVGAIVLEGMCWVRTENKSRVLPIKSLRHSWPVINRD